MELKALLPQVVQTLATAPCMILEAPPGTGKTTTVPPALLAADWLAGQKILMLEPRRIAARAAARYLAAQRGEVVGQSVGYRVRLESRVGPQTRLEVVTEGVLTRLLQQDPALEGYGLILFDEFHERSLQADLGLALCREIQQVLRPELRLLIMSATLPTHLSDLLGGVPLLRASGVTHPVSMRYAAPATGQDLLSHAASVIRQSLREQSGSLLVFLPGAGEIRRLSGLLDPLPADVRLSPLYGDLSPAEQDLAIQPAPAGLRKLVLATNLAETSLTIEGIRGVIDLGLERAPVFDPVSGMTRLITRPISRASAHQRSGRAGRLEPGFCLRLWPESDTARLLPEIEPEILSADLAPLALDLARWGCRDPGELAWLDPPPPHAWAQACDLLTRLGARDTEGRITPHGQALARLPLHPRLGHMVLKARALELGGLACTVAALLSERDLFSGSGRETDLSARVQALKRGQIPAGRRQAVEQAAAQTAALLQLTPAQGPLAACGQLLALAYPDRIAQRRGQSARYLLANGRGAVLPEGDPLTREPYLAVAQLDGHPREARIFLAAALDPEALAELSTDQTRTELDISFNPQTQSVQAFRVERYGALTLQRTAIPNPDAAVLAEALLLGVRQRGLAQLAWTPAQQHLRERVAFVRGYRPDWPDLSDSGLEATLSDWLLPFLNGLRRLEAITPELLQQALEYHLGAARMAELGRLAPTHWPVPSGSQIRLDYSGPEPVLAARLQELFGLLATPALLDGQVPLLIHLLSPARRPVQVTRDLASFWRETYPLVKKELKGRYPKHFWPDNPLEAEATRGVRRR
jgi:ATP-dependent helicase HrpB